jgi:hypothetical protein
MSDEIGRSLGEPADYKMAHTAPDSGYGVRMNDPEDMFPDIFEHPEYYATGNRRVDAESMDALRRAARGPDTLITVYRAVPRGVNQINPSDWVTPSRTYAQEHGELMGGGLKVLSLQVRAGDLFSAGDLAEWGWAP